MISFYNNKKHYSVNSPNYISMLSDISGLANPTATLGMDTYPILSRDYRNGISCVAGSGFYLNTSSSINTVEFFFTPKSFSSAGGLVSSSASGSYVSSAFSWDSSGVVSKTNISAIYVNRIDKSAETNISNIFKLKDINHVILVFSSPITGPIIFNYTASGAVEAVYQNIISYPTAFTAQKSYDHHDLWVYREARSLTDSSISMTESGVEYYNNDWIVIQNV